jgi:hypothetical protein
LEIVYPSSDKKETFKKIPWEYVVNNQKNASRLPGEMNYCIQKFTFLLD